MDKQGVYKTIKISGLLSFIPLSLLAGPFGGYFLGNFLCARFGLKTYVIFITIGIGFLVSIVETVRIIRSVLGELNKKILFC